MYKVKSGFFAFTQLTDETRHQEYNWWHSSDHQPENLAIDGVVRAERWAAPRRYMEARSAHPTLAPMQYLAHYLMTEPLAPAKARFHELGAELRKAGRFFEARNIVSLGHHDLLKAYVAPRLEIAPEALPFRPHRGVFVVIKHLLDPARQQDLARFHDEVHIPDVLTLKGVMGACWFQATGEAVTPVQGLSAPVNRQVFVYYLDEEPLETLRDLQEKLPVWQATGRSRAGDSALEVLFSGLFETIEDPAGYDWRAR